MEIKHKVLAVHPRLSDEEPDPLEAHDPKDGSIEVTISEGWLPWTADDIADIRRIINRLDPKQQFIMEAYLDGMSFIDMSVSEKYWRYHLNKGIEIIRKELDL